jgi:tetratricopeptide (TPR) repeat protein
MSANLEREEAILQETADEIQAIGEQLSEAPPQRIKDIQKQYDRKLDIYWKQISSFSAEFPDSVESKIHEASFYGYQALGKFHRAGAMRRASDQAGSTTLKLATGLIAKQQEKNNAMEALRLLDKSIATFDNGGAHLSKATIYYCLKQKDNALKELNYIIKNFTDDVAYRPARQLKDEIETPPKKGMCFVATAAYGSPTATEVVILSRFRDDVLLHSKVGSVFVAFYYRISPALASLIVRNELLRAATRGLFLAPILRLMKAIKLIQR